MQVLDIILADYASPSQGGKFTLVGGGFTDITVPKVPFVHPLMFMLLRLRLQSGDLGKNRVEVKITGGGEELFRADCNLGVSRLEAHTAVLSVPVRVMNLRLPHLGEYAIEVWANGACSAVQAFRVLEFKPKQA